MNKLICASALAIAILTSCSKKKTDAGSPGDDTGDKATPEDCQRAYDHLADLQAATGHMTKEEALKLSQGNLEHCPRMTTKAGIDCLLALQKHDLMAEADCGSK